MEAIIEELELRTSIDGLKERRITTLSDPDLFFSPFLYMAGKYEFEPFDPGEGDFEAISYLSAVSSLPKIPWVPRGLDSTKLSVEEMKANSTQP